ncbi:glutamine--fructose-6-phosphate aminotransferase [candidate division WOR-1 bacterium RIFOXYA12_FULL_43_27]|uniref:Glutamine--fructose-6-phosphate aminotransferase [isomerizing] n=1 Tax=candidate division WOR-1 bacterium RIFOXYC2_FULL_46_14 TaxID=1802587 RepID=A0A1F4U7W8_UNCSA|nr:MAG: glutamine--fructose-6-phosphate aminotransferase [candidate division WOR-1 bacterium RIFOXYA12_FULL_43_27]OGC20551.1 MAG: glutamine--fructose-6-phosphate aminotransferase [candidate division WOR-1 bacterium RIFOXYB2_FULL_46_45]OGC31712.1 MAG: glutamine--fructose-6-phosphate aminotransferase [candidate division WOR-1 bacterium RIFOXYA2_FULL_46_56]OGC40393.1 MAG: glutamine--fructose-6-phosphate aminotransferase [candidate division WOR-1 bacterium RIFOXYC2_FULL_46_14]
MCGIFGYIGKREALPFILEGLKKLEYRGYDSAGVSTIQHGKIFLNKSCGKIARLEEVLEARPIGGSIGIGHTRWATHGKPSDENSHPHSDCSDQITVVHNGIIENYLELRRQLAEEGHKFTSATDTEVIAHLIEKYFKETGSLETAVRKTLNAIDGSYALGVISEHEPDKLIAARKGSPLLIGIEEDETFIASDISALIKYTSRVIYLNDYELAVITENDIVIKDRDGKTLKKNISFISWDPESAEKCGYTHFMLKEIHEQPNAIRKTIEGRISAESANIHFDELNLTEKEIKNINRVVFTACGTSWHAALVGEYLIEQMVKLPAEVEYAAEFRYRHPVIDDKTLVIAISQSGETADTLAAAWEAKSLGAKVISICNVVGSTLARDSHGVIYTQAGPEIGVASTKAFTTQLSVIYLLTLLLARTKGTLTGAEIKNYIHDLIELPGKIEQVLAREHEIEKIAQKYYLSNNALFLGRGKGFPIALEGALKLKEISYIHAEGYPAAEMKHGPIALIDQNMPVVVLAMTGKRYEKILGNIEEVKARGGQVIAIANEGDNYIQEKADEVFYLPKSPIAVSPILAVIPLQLLAYYIAVKRGCHIDQPRNLAKSVTVE